MRTKLAIYLSRTKESHRKFAARAGIANLHPMISQWAAGKRWPGLKAAVLMERATDGAVPAAYWFDLRRKVESTPDNQDAA